MHLLHRYKKVIARGVLLLFMCVAFVAPTLEGVQIAHVQANVNNSQTIAGTTATAQNVDEDDVTNFGCYDGGLGPNWLAGCTALITYYLLFKPAYVIAGWASILFNVAFFKLVVGMGETVDVMSGIDTAWTALRDIGNIFLVFLLVYVGVATILGIAGYGYRRLLWKVLVAALLVNFSITFTKVVIDVSNLAAITMFDEFMDDASYGNAGALNTANCLQGGGSSKSLADTTDGDRNNLDNNECLTNGLAGAFWTQLHVTAIFKGNTVTNASGKATEAYWGMVWASLFGAMMFIIMAFVFGATAFLLVSRFVILLFLMIISPIALIAWITGVSNGGSRWWHTLLNQSMFAPLILLMWWVAYTVMGGLTSNVMQFNTESIVAPSNISVILTFIIVSGFLIAGLVVAKSLGAHGASGAMNVGRKWSRKAALGVAGGAGAVGGWAASQTAGRWSHNAAQKHREAAARRWETDEHGKYKDQTAAGRLARTKLGAKVNRGTQNIIKAGSEKRFGNAQSFKERREATKKATEAQQRGYETINRKKELKTAIGDIGESSNPETVRRAKDKIRKASTAELLEHKDTLKEKPELLAHASQNKFDKIIENKDGTFSDSEVRTFTEARDKHFADPEKFGTEEVKNEVNTTAPKNLVKHGKGFFAREDVVQNIDKKTMDGLVASGLSQEKREAIRSVVEAKHKEIAKKYDSAGSSDSNIAAPDGQPARKKVDASQLTKEEKKIMELHDWFSDDNKMAV